MNAHTNLMATNKRRFILQQIPILQKVAAIEPTKVVPNLEVKEMNPLPKERSTMSQSSAPAGFNIRGMFTALLFFILNFVLVQPMKTLVRPIKFGLQYSLFAAALAGIGFTSYQAWNSETIKNIKNSLPSIDIKWQEKNTMITNLESKLGKSSQE